MLPLKESNWYFNCLLWNLLVPGTVAAMQQAQLLEANCLASRNLCTHFLMHTFSNTQYMHSAYDHQLIFVLAKSCYPFHLCVNTL